jgi:hypothetical protein
MVRHERRAENRRCPSRRAIRREKRDVEDEASSWPGTSPCQASPVDAEDDAAHHSQASLDHEGSENELVAPEPLSNPPSNPPPAAPGSRRVAEVAAAPADVSDGQPVIKRGVVKFFDPG